MEYQFHPPIQGPISAPYMQYLEIKRNGGLTVEQKLLEVPPKPPKPTTSNKSPPLTPAELALGLKALRF
jgi:hypothetical protein